MSLTWAYRFFVACVVSGVITAGLALAVVADWGVQAFQDGKTDLVKPEQVVALAPDGSRQALQSLSQKEQIESAESAEEILAAIKQTATNHGLEIRTEIPKKHRAKVSGEETANSDIEGVRSFGVIFVEEISKYPDNFLRKNGVKTILLLKDPQISDERGDYHFGGLAIAEDDLIVLDYTDGQFHAFGEARYTDYPGGGCSSSDVNIRKGIHHEIWHLIDETHLGYKDAGWSKLNDSDFSYSQPKTFAGFAVDYHDCRIVRGGDFTTPYAQIDTLEDRADTYAYLMTTELYVPNREALEFGDGKLPQKIAFIKRQLKKIDSRMTDQYFSNLHQ